MTLGPGGIVRLHASGVEYVVGDELGKGGQGSVFRAEPVGGGTQLALKWYRGEAATAGQLGRLRRILQFERPAPDFLWPIDLAGREGKPGFGYVMPIRAEPFVPMTHAMNGIVALRLREECTAGARLANAFLRLHALGLCYADVSVNNLFLDPATGDIQVCDNDNVTIDGGRSDVLGTPYFMAPEVVRGEASPSTATDRHSLAVILYMMLMRTHPLFGARESDTAVLDATSLSRLLGFDPLFTFDPTDASNRPVERFHDNALLLWPMLPAFVQRLFVAAFTTGLSEPMHGRVTETAWRAALVRLRGAVRTCPACGAEQFFDDEQPRKACAARDCDEELGAPAQLVVRHPIVLERGVQLRRSDLVGMKATDDVVIADVVAHPTTGELALRNRSTTAWTLTRGGTSSTIAPRAAFVIRDTHRVQFGEATGRILLPAV